MALIDHVSDVGCRPGFPLVEKNLVKNSEDLIRVDRAERQIVVSVTAIIKMESAEHVFRKQPGDDLLDILRLIMMTGINQHFCLWPGGAGKQQ